MPPGKRSGKSFLQRILTGQELLTTLTVVSTALGITVGLLLRVIFKEKTLVYEKVFDK